MGCKIFKEKQFQYKRPLNPPIPLLYHLSIQNNKLTRQSNRQKRPERWQNKHAHRQNGTDLPDKKPSSNNLHRYKGIKPYRKPKGRNSKKDYSLGRLVGTLSQGLDSHNTCLSRMSVLQSFSLSCLPPNKFHSTFTHTFLKITRMYAPRISKSKSQCRSTFTRTTNESYLRFSSIISPTWTFRARPTLFT